MNSPMDLAQGKRPSAGRWARVAQGTVLSVMLGCLWGGVAVGAPDSVLSESARLDRARAYFGDHELIDQDGVHHRFVTDLLQDHVVLINVVYTKCRDACPLVTRLLGLVKAQLGDTFGRTVLFLSLSSDPRRDTPETLKAFASKHQADSPGWRFLSADEAVMKPLLSRLGQWSEDPADHQTLLLAGNAARAHWVKIRPDATPEFIVAELQRVAAKP